MNFLKQKPSNWQNVPLFAHHGWFGQKPINIEKIAFNISLLSLHPWLWYNVNVFLTLFSVLTNLPSRSTSMYLSCLSSQSLRLSCVFCNLFFFFYGPAKTFTSWEQRGLFCCKSRSGNEEWHTLLLRGSKSVTLQWLCVLRPTWEQMSQTHLVIYCFLKWYRGVVLWCWNSNYTYIKLSHGCLSGKYLVCFYRRERTNVCSSSFLLEDWKTTTALHPQITLDLK